MHKKNCYYKQIDPTYILRSQSAKQLSTYPFKSQGHQLNRCLCTFTIVCVYFCAVCHIWNSKRFDFCLFFLCFVRPIYDTTIEQCESQSSGYNVFNLDEKSWKKKHGFKFSITPRFDMNATNSMS